MNSQVYEQSQTMLGSVRRVLQDETTELVVPSRLQERFDPEISQIYITLFQEGRKPIRWGSRRGDAAASLRRVIQKLRSHRDFPSFDIDNPSVCRIMFEMVTEERAVTMQSLTTQFFVPHRFEPGITGFKLEYKDKTYYVMPNDAIVHSIMSLRQMLNHISKRLGIAKQTNSITGRIELLLNADIQFTLIQSISYITYHEKVLPLYRGQPLPTFTKEVLFDSTIQSLDWLIEHMRPDGSFLYFYDPTKDSEVDFEHPRMKDPLYYNILRHSGGTIALLRGYELTHDTKYLKYAKYSLDYFCTTLRTHRYKGKKTIYPFFNKKSKLGGAGIGLVAMMHYYMHTGDEEYREQMDGLVRHILSRVDRDGEMIGYYIHPKYNNGKALIRPSDEIKQELFSFYYPGEALLGLALYLKHIRNIDPDLREDILLRSKMALDFLVDVRPVKYKHLFTTLPADAWLMQAIEEWMDVEGFDRQSYIDFTYGDADTMIRQMYTEENAPYPDYVGGFFYYYGDHVYQDASRCEGIIAAYHTARKRDDEAKARYYMVHMMKAAHGLMLTRHTPESTYACRYPDKVIGSFRFKLTRSWVRVDSVQHAACFYSRLCIDLNCNRNILNEKKMEKKYMASLKILQDFDKAQLWRFFVDGRFHKKYNGWVGYEKKERGSVKALINGFSFMIDNIKYSKVLSASYIRELHRACLLNVEVSNPKSTPGDIKYKENGNPFQKSMVTYENIVEVLKERKDDNSIFSNTPGLQRPANELDAKYVFDLIQEKGRVTYRPWYPILDQNTKDAIDGKKSLHEFYEAKHYVQMLVVNKMESIVDEYNVNINNAQNDDEKLETIALLIRKLELLHPFPDGNCRVFAAILLNQLLIYHNFTPTILMNPTLDIKVTLPEWIKEIKDGMAITKKLLDNYNSRVFNYSIVDMPKNYKTEFINMATVLIEKINNYREVYLTPRRAEYYTGGIWINGNYDFRFNGVGYNSKIKGGIHFPLAKDGQKYENIKKYIDAGISAVVLDKKDLLKDISIPILFVENVFNAFKNVAINVRRDLNPITVLISGTEGKTGAKMQLYHLLKVQTNVHAILNTANVRNSVLRSLADLGEHDQVEITEVSVNANEIDNIRRGEEVNPDFCFYTNIGPNHIDMHKNIDSIIHNKACLIKGLKKNGVCIVNSSIVYYDDFIMKLNEMRPGVKILTFGEKECDTAYIINKIFNTQSLGWEVEANVMGNKVHYFLPMVQSHLPLTSVGLLLLIFLMGYDVQKAAKDFESFSPYRTMGRLHKLKKNNRNFLFYDQSSRGSLSGMKSAFYDLRNFKIKGKIVALLGGISIKEDSSWTQESHRKLAELISNSKIAKLYTTGPYMNYVHENLIDKSIFIRHDDNLEVLSQDLKSEVDEDDLLFIMGAATLYLNRIVKYILDW